MSLFHICNCRQYIQFGRISHLRVNLTLKSHRGLISLYKKSILRMALFYAVTFNYHQREPDYSFWINKQDKRQPCFFFLSRATLLVAFKFVSLLSSILFWGKTFPLKTNQFLLPPLFFSFQLFPLHNSISDAL